jgi:hypothetical protein
VCSQPETTTPMLGKNGNLAAFRSRHMLGIEQCERCWQEKHKKWLDARAATRKAERAKKREEAFVRSLEAKTPWAKQIAQLNFNIANMISVNPDSLPVLGRFVLVSAVL